MFVPSSHPAVPDLDGSGGESAATPMPHSPSPQTQHQRAPSSTTALATSAAATRPPHTTARVGGGVPRRPGGGYTQDVVQLIARVTLGGDFSAIFRAVGGNTSANAKALRHGLRTSLEAWLGYPVAVTALQEGSLVADFVMAVAAGDVALQDALARDTAAMGASSSDRAWLQALEEVCRANGGCTSGIGSVTATVVSRLLVIAAGEAATTTTPAGTAAPVFWRDGVRNECNVRCIAAVVTGLVVTLVVVVASMCIYARRLPQPKPRTVLAPAERERLREVVDRRTKTVDVRAEQTRSLPVIQNPLA
jgi:hypothetical protein